MAIDWTKSMQQTFEFFEVNPESWFDKAPITTVKSASITRDSDNETLQNATLDVVGLDREIYIRIYLKCIQDGKTYREPIGTFLVQTPSVSFDGKLQCGSVNAYSPLIELKEKKPTIGFSDMKNQRIMQNVSQLTSDNVRAPVIFDTSSTKVIELESGFVANTDDTWLSYLTDLIKNAEYTFDIDPKGVIFFSPYQKCL